MKPGLVPDKIITVQTAAILDQERAIRTVLDAVPAEVLAARVRRERLSQGISIRDLAAKAQVGKSSIVRLEAGESSRPVTLLKICTALGLHPDRLAEEGATRTTAMHTRSDDRWYELEGFGSGVLGGLDRPLTAQERRKLVEKGARNPLLLLKSRLPEGKLLPTLIEVYEPSEERSHPGEEFVFVLRGTVLITVNGEDFKLEEGESLHFWGTEPHAYSPFGPEPALVLSARINP